MRTDSNASATPERTRTRTLPILLGALVACSGGAGLVYEMLWIRALGLHFGTTTPALTTVVATYMAGLGLGQWWFGARADRSARPLSLYRRLEASIAVSALATSLVLLRGGPLLDALARMCARAGALSTPATIVVFSLLMLAPATAMGGTLPVLSRALSRRTQGGRTLGLVYGLNTLGAIAGALAPDFVLIPRLGLTATACAAAGCNVLVALALGFFVEAEDRPAFTREHVDAPLSRAQLAAFAISGGSGLSAMALEVLWSRTLQHWTTALVTSFAVLLAVYLAALTAGTLLTRRWADGSAEPMPIAAALTGVTAVLALLPIVWAFEWRDLEQRLWPRPLGVRRVDMFHEAVDALLHATYLEAAACFAMGASFPYLAAACLGENTRTGTRTGQLLLVNTFCGVIGALVMGFVALPRLGEQASYGAVALLLASLATACAWLSQPMAAARTATLLGLVLTISFGLPSDQLRKAHFRSGGDVIAVQEGSTTSAAVVERYVYGEPYYRELLTPGVSMSSTRPDARRYMAMMAHAALLAARRPARALLICYGVGNTAAALLSHASLEQLDVVDVSPEVLALAPRFAAAHGGDPLRDPRTHVFVDDGRHHLITHAAVYDVITAEPPPPNHAGVVNLYAREFYRLAKRRLSAGGVITQWLPVFQLSDADVNAMIAAFTAEFPHTALLYGYEQQLILIGSMQPLSLDPARLHDPALLHDLQANSIGGVADVLGAGLASDAELRRQVTGIEPLSDERPSIQYPMQAVREGTFYPSRFDASVRRGSMWLAATLDDGLRRDVEHATVATWSAVRALPALALDEPLQRERALARALQPALDARPDDEGLWALLGADRTRVELAQRALQRPGVGAFLENSRARASARYWVLQDALWVLARRAYYEHDCTRAHSLVERITPEPHVGALRAWLESSCMTQR